MLRQRCVSQMLRPCTSRCPASSRFAFSTAARSPLRKISQDPTAKRRIQQIEQAIGPFTNQTRLVDQFWRRPSISSFHSTIQSRLANESSEPSPTKPATKRRSILRFASDRENITNLPNLLTLTRLVAAPAIGYLVLHDHNVWAVSLLAYASITDLVDGYVARHWNLQTVIGSVLDPLADKLLMTILTVCLAMKAAIPLWLAGVILGKDVGLGIAAIYFRWISLPPPKTFWRYWDFSLPSAEVKPTTISKYNTALQLLLLMVATAEPLIVADISTAMTALQYTVGTTTVWSGLSYIYTKDAVRILPREKNTDAVEEEKKKL